MINIIIICRYQVTSIHILISSSLSRDAISDWILDLCKIIQFWRLVCFQLLQFCHVDSTWKLALILYLFYKNRICLRIRLLNSNIFFTILIFHAVLINLWLLLNINYSLGCPYILKTGLYWLFEIGSSCPSYLKGRMRSCSNQILFIFNIWIVNLTTTLN